MATSGLVKTNVTYDSYFWVKWEQKSQDITANKTTIAWYCGVTCGHSFYSNAIKWTKALYINGVLVYSGGTYSNFSKGEHQIASGQLDISHSANGNKNFFVSSFAGWLYSGYTYEAAATEFSLNPIPRKATIIAVDDFTDLDNPSITFSNPGGFPVDVWLEPNPEGDHLCVRNGIPNTGSYTWTLTDDERNELRNKCPGKDCTIRVGLYTHIGDTTYNDYRDKKFTMVESDATRPAVSLTVALNNGSLPSKFGTQYIQGKSKVDITVGGDGKYGANIKDCYAVVEGKTYKSGSTSDVIAGSGEITITGYVVDSRGFTGTAEAKVNVAEYSKPLVVPPDGENAVQCYRSDASGNRVGNGESVWVKAKRSYHTVNGKNNCSLRWRCKLPGDQWEADEGEPLIGYTDTTDVFSGLLGSDFALDKSYIVQVMSIDDVGEYDIKTFEIPTRDVALHLGRGGKNVAIGTYCDTSIPYTFYSQWKAIFDGGVMIGNKTLKEYIQDVINGGG